MVKPRALVTGGNGFVGRYLVELLLDEGFDVFAHVLAHEKEAVACWAGSIGKSGLSIAFGDLTEPGAAGVLLAATRPDYIFHLAARASGADSDRDAVFKVNVDAARSLFDIASLQSLPPKVLAISTGYVYGNTDPTRPARETDALAEPGRFGAYTDSKLKMELAAAEYGVLVARSFSHTGPGQSPTFAVPSFAKQIAAIERGELDPVIRVGNLEALRDLLDVRDVVRAYVGLANSPALAGSYNVANGSPVSMHSVLETLCALSCVSVRIEIDPSRLRTADISCSTGDSALLNSITGWAPALRLEQTLHDTLNYWRSQPS